MTLIAIKSFSYNTRRLQAGDVFSAKTDRDEKILIAVKNARKLEDRPETKIPQPNKELLEKINNKEEPAKIRSNIRRKRKN